MVDVNEMPVGVFNEKQQSGNAVKQELTRIRDTVFFDELGERIVGRHEFLKVLKALKALLRQGSWKPFGPCCNDAITEMRSRQVQ